jgi:hypothetical protein
MTSPPLSKHMKPSVSHERRELKRFRWEIAKCMHILTVASRKRGTSCTSRASMLPKMPKRDRQVRWRTQLLHMQHQSSRCGCLAMMWQMMSDVISTEMPYEPEFDSDQFFSLPLISLDAIFERGVIVAIRLIPSHICHFPSLFIASSFMNLAQSKAPASI